MNAGQKVLTLVFLAVFVATLIWCPWQCFNWRSYSALWMPPRGSCDVMWQQLVIEWIPIAVLYTGLFAVFKRAPK